MFSDPQRREERSPQRSVIAPKDTSQRHLGHQ